MSDLADRLRILKEKSGLSTRSFAARAGMSEGGLRAIFREKADSATLRSIRQIAEANEVSPAWLAFGTGEIDMDLRIGLPAGEDRFVSVLGQVAAGAWHEVDDGVDEPRTNRKLVTDPRFPTVAQYGLTVVGESMNELFADQDDLLCLDFRQVPDGPRPTHDDIVIVEQLRAGGSLRELSAKQLKLTPSGPVLEARSNHPKWAGFKLTPTSANDNDSLEIHIKALVLRSERQWWGG